MIQGSGPELNTGFVNVFAAGGGGIGAGVLLFLHEEKPMQTINEITPIFFSISPWFLNKQ
jgi:hypothetical protein